MTETKRQKKIRLRAEHRTATCWPASELRPAGIHRFGPDPSPEDRCHCGERVLGNGRRMTREEAADIYAKQLVAQQRAAAALDEEAG